MGHVGFAAPAGDGPRAEYVFGVTVRLDPVAEGVALDPATFETRLHRAADPPGEPGWLFFRDTLWRGEVADEAHVRDLAAEALGVPVEAADFRELRTTPGYLDALRAALADDLDRFNADTVDAVVSNHLGSSIRVIE